jgi:hypothetical protein
MARNVITRAERRLSAEMRNQPDISRLQRFKKPLGVPVLRRCPRLSHHAPSALKKQPIEKNETHSIVLRPCLHFTVSVILAKYSVRLPRCSIVSRLPQAMM